MIYTKNIFQKMKNYKHNFERLKEWIINLMKLLQKQFNYINFKKNKWLITCVKWKIIWIKKWITINKKLNKWSKPTIIKLDKWLNIIIEKMK
jgi:hypothetical protein